ncbi:siderophore ABC transporter substrate-binding protein [Paenalkalicoccus suaedae]|uniref:Siderophore ABC transporter substrate-binding protein n=1 Tax=Paenalkalicoccus suaedae TaxID=2592382 RepID=A0A859F9I3_9BACI|nr:siderophore ABC transporter substrate-binding protein [Paenalkalicoccus suaedae]QKS69803.1 siderophore ABC transporter substrate-binding protein [Paenalkalicoccus suaedae]
MKKTLLGMSTLAILLAACGNEEASSNASEGNTTNEVNQTEATSNEANTTEEEPTELVVEHDLGETTVPTNPEKVVVFDYGVLDTMRELGVDPIAVPQGNIPSYLNEFESDTYQNAGTLFEPNFEAIFDMDPDLILISGRAAEAYDELSDIAPTVFLGLDTENYVESFEHNTMLLGEIFGKEEEAAEQLATIEEEIEALQSVASGEEGNGLILLTNEGELSAYGTGSRFGLIHDDFGVGVADETIDNSTRHGQNVSFEYVLETNPDYLFVIDRGAVVSDGGEVDGQATLDNDIVGQTTAATEGNVMYLNPEYWYLSSGGLRSVSEMVKEVASVFE